MNQDPRRGKLLAIALTIAAYALFAFNDAFVRLIADEVGVVEAVWGRFTFFFLWIAATAMPSQWHAILRASQPVILVLRGLIVAVGNFLMIAAMGYISYAAAAAIIFLAPVLTLLVAIRLLGERVGLRLWIAAIVGCAGMTVITRPWSAAFHPAYLYVLGTMFAIVGYQILTRFVATRADARAALFFMALTAAVASSCVVPFAWSAPTPMIVAGMAGTGLLYLISHTIFIVAHRHAEASTLAPFSYFQLVGAMLAGFLMFGQTPDAYTYAGASAIIIAGLLIITSYRHGPPAAS